MYSTYTYIFLIFLHFYFIHILITVKIRFAFFLISSVFGSYFMLNNAFYIFKKLFYYKKITMLIFCYHRLFQDSKDHSNQLRRDVFFLWHQILQNDERLVYVYENYLNTNIVLLQYVCK